MRLLLAIILTLSFFITQPVFAEDFLLNQIGGLPTQGKKMNQWWYEPQQVVLKGTGSRGANIDITLDGKFNVTKASVDNGAWSFDLGNLSIADHSIIVASGDQSYPFVLTIGSAAPAAGAANKSILPITGGILPLVGIISVAGVLIFLGLKKNEA